jgi:hypothetical protein
MRFYEIAEAILDPKKAAEYTKVIDIPKAIAIAETHCSDALNAYVKTGKSLFKGFNNWSAGNKFEDNFYAIDSSQIARRSQNTNNIYTFFTSKVSQAWKQFPPRDRALICSTSTKYAGGYGTLFCVFPENGTKIGVCPSFDMWESFEESHLGSLGDFASFMQNRMIDWAKKQNLIDADARYWDFEGNKLDKFIPAFLKQPISVLNTHEEASYYSIDQFSKNTSVGQYMERVLDPVLNNFSIVTPNQIASLSVSGKAGSELYGGTGRECWFSGRCVIANKDALDHLIKQGKFK